MTEQARGPDMSAAEGDSLPAYDHLLGAQGGWDKTVGEGEEL